VLRADRSLARVLTLTHDITSPASAIAVARLQRLADEGVPVTFRGIDVLGLDATVPVTLDVLAELERVRADADTLGLILRRPSRRPPTVLVHVIADLADDVGLGAAWRTAAYQAYWRDDLDLGDPSLVASLAGHVGLDGELVDALLADSGGVAAVRRRTHAARGEGIGGVPVLIAHGTLVRADLDEASLRQLAGW
jgi:2-hydroxychromene-2-carboxylate isomerase